MAGNSSTRLGKKRTRLVEESIKDELERKKIKEEQKETNDGDDDGDEKKNAAPAVNLILFLPEQFLVERLLPTKMEFDTPDEVPSWNPCPIPVQKAGMTRSLGASLTKGNVLCSNAYTEICIRPRFGPKKNGQWYDFIDNGGRLIGKDLGYFDPDNEDTRHNNKTALELLELHLTELQKAVNDFGAKQTKWRCHRRQWEYDYVKWLWAKHPNTLVHENKITSVDIDNLKIFVDEENEKDKKGEYGPWRMGRLDDVNQIFVQHKDRDTVAKITVPAQIAKTKDAITRLKAHLDGKKVIPDNDDEELLIMSDKEDDGTGNRHEDDDDDFPVPKNRTLVMNWVIERYESWIKPNIRPKASKANKVAAYNDKYVTGTTEELHGNEWPDGATCLNANPSELNAPDEDLDAFPWGKPAAKMINAFKKTTYYNADAVYSKEARKLLILIEEWYFKLDKRERAALADKDMKDWKMSRSLKNQFKEVINSLMD